MVGGTAPPRGGQCHANDHNYEDDTDEKVKKMMMPIQKLVAGGTAPPRGGHTNDDIDDTGEKYDDDDDVDDYSCNSFNF